MKQIAVILGMFLSLNSFSQGKYLGKLVGRWEMIGPKSGGGILEIIDSNTIVMSYNGDKKVISSVSFDFSKTPIWFDFRVRDSSSTIEVKTIMEMISDDLIKWQIFMDEERALHFTASKGELFYLKRSQIKTVVTFAATWDKKNYSVLRN